MVRNRVCDIAAAALAACLVALVAAASLGFVLSTGLMFVLLPQSKWAVVLIGGLLVLVFGLVFIVCFREMMEKLTPP